MTLGYAVSSHLKLACHDVAKPWQKIDENRNSEQFHQNSEAALTLPVLELTLSNAQAKDANIFENHLNPVMLVIIGKLSISTLR